MLPACLPVGGYAVAVFCFCSSYFTVLHKYFSICYFINEHLSSQDSTIVLV